MATFDIFNNSAFSLTELSGQIEKVDYVPGQIGSLNLFTPKPVRTRSVWVDRRQSEISLIQTSPLGAPPAQAGKVERDMIGLQIPRLYKQDVLTAAELDGIRAFGTESELEAVATEINDRMTRLRRDLELTWEKHRLGALSGVLLDADGSTIANYYTAFGESVPDTFDFELDDDTTDVGIKCLDLKEEMLVASKGALLPGTRIHVLCGSSFYRQLISHPSVEKEWLGWRASAAVRNLDPFDMFDFAGVVFHNYRGTNDGTSIAINTTAAKAFPVGSDIFEVAFAPYESLSAVGSRGQAVYANIVRDLKRDFYAEIEVFSYPLHYCKRPNLLIPCTAS
jgi:hypothetical protein